MIATDLKTVLAEARRDSFMIVGTTALSTKLIVVPYFGFVHLTRIDGGAAS